VNLYEQDVVQRLDELVSNISEPDLGPNSFAALLLALESYSQSPGVTSEQGESMTTEVLLAVFDRHCATWIRSNLDYELLEQLFTNDRWHALMETVETAHSFICMVTSYIETRQDFFTKLYGDNMLARFAKAISGWLAPESNLERPALRDFAVALFGEPWCVLMYDSRSPNILLAHVISATRPAFLPGRLRAGSVQETMQLPDIMSPA
jgi:hypothetical protein